MDCCYSVRIFVSSCIAELLGTLLFVLCGTASTIDLVQVPSKASVALAFGLIYAVLVNMTSSFSGGHLNPAVTIAMAIRRQISLLKGFCYVVVQCGAACLGSFLLTLLIPSYKRSLGVTTLGNQVLPFLAVVVELIMTFLLVLTVLLCRDGNRKVSDGEAALWSGLVVIWCHLFGYQLTGCGMNPARSLGPAVVAGVWDYHWVYWAGPIAGALLASFLHYLATNYPISTNEIMAIRGRALDLPIVTAHQIDHEVQTDKVSDRHSTAAESPRFLHAPVPAEMKTYL